MTQLLPEDVLLALAREHLSGLADVFLAPDIPPRKLRGAREAHELHLGTDEPILVLFDSTMLGSGSDGFIATPAQLCWKNFLEHPRRMLWDDLSPLPLYAEDKHVEIALGQVPAPWTFGGSERVRAFLMACRHYRRGGTAPYRQAARIRDATTHADVIVKAARQALGEREWIHYFPSIPPRMLAAVRTVHASHLGEHEEILVLYDDTLFGSGNDGLLFTERGFYWRSFLGAAEAIAWPDLPADTLSSDGDLLLLGDGRTIDLRIHNGMASLIAELLRELAGGAKGARLAASHVL